MFFFSYSKCGWIFAYILPLAMSGGIAHANLNASECLDTDLSPKYGPIRDQGSSPWCSQFAAADLITYAQGIGPRDQVSALDVAVNFLTTDPKKLGEVANHQNNWLLALQTKRLQPLNEALDAARKGKAPIDRANGMLVSGILAYQLSAGSCLESKVRSQETIRRDNRGFIERQLKRLGDVSVTEAEQLIADESQACPEMGIGSRPALQTLIAKLNEESMANVKSSIDRECRQRRPLREMWPQTMVTEPGTGTAARALASLLNQRLPTAISYDARFLTNGVKDPGPVEAHVSVIAGMRWNKRKKMCEFKIRNSWGPTCDGYHESLRKQCEGGSIWIDEKTLDPRIGSVQTVLTAKP